MDVAMLPPGCRPARALVVDDDPGIRQLLTRALAYRGIEADAVENGRAALDRLDADPTVGLLLLDLEMPVMNGFQVLARLRNGPRADLPVMVVSAKDLTDEERITLTQSAQAVCDKRGLSLSAVQDRAVQLLADYASPDSTAGTICPAELRNVRD